MIQPTHIPSSTLRINEQVQRLWSSGQIVYHLGFGESRMPVHPKLVAALAENASQRHYLPALGLSELRWAVADFYTRQWGISATADRVVIGPGSKAIMYAIQLALKCQLYLPIPAWVSYAPQAELVGSPVIYIPATQQPGDFTIDDLDQILDTDTRQRQLLIINSPNNPTGMVMDESFLQALAEYCRARDLLVLSDEIYALTRYDRQPHRSLATYYPEGTIVVGGPSKHFSIGGWRLGVAILPDSAWGTMLASALQAIASEIWSSPSAPIQHAAVVAYQNDPELTDYIQLCTDLHQYRTIRLRQSLVNLGIRCTQPQGGFYFVANFDHWDAGLANLGLINSDRLAEYLLDSYQLATLPGTPFGIPSDQRSLRISSSILDMETDSDSHRIMTLFQNDRHTLPESELPQTMSAVAQFEAFVSQLG